jgi:hypothetical protein
MSTAGIVPFDFGGREVRTVAINNEPWFNIGDLCAVLGIQNPRDVAAKNLDSEDVAKIYVSSGGQQRKVWFTNEPGLYQLILRSNKPDARVFKRWITREVLPSIRKTGRFQIDLRGWLSNGPKPWTKTFPDRYYSEILRLHGKDPSRLKEREPWLAQLTTFLIYNRLDQGVVETLQRINPVPSGKRWRPRKLHQHIAHGEAENQFRQLLGECVGALTVARSWNEFLTAWNIMHPLVAALPVGVEATLSDGQLWLFTSSLAPETPRSN